MSSGDLSSHGTLDRSFTTTEAFLHTLASQASIGILLSDPYGNCHFVNQRLCELSGLTLAAAAGEGWTKALHADDRKRVLDEWHETTRHIRPFSSEFRFQRSDGTGRWVHGEGFALRTQPSEISGHFLMVRDITARKQAVEALRVSEERYRSLVHLSPHAILVIADETIAFANQAGLRMMGVASATELVGRSHLDFIHPSIRDHGASIKTEEAPFPREATILRRDGATVEVEIVGAPISFDGRSSLLLILTDITERKHAQSSYLIARQEAVAHRQDARRMEAMAILSGGITHEFNNCLTAILGFSELAMPSVAPDSKAHGHLQQVVTASRKARDLVNQLLVFRQQPEPAKQPVSLHVLLRETLRRLKPALQQNITVETWIQTPTHPVLADPAQLHQVCVSLVANAEQAMKETGGLLTVRLSDVLMEPPAGGCLAQLAAGEYVCLTTTYTSQGPRISDHTAVFAPFGAAPHGENGSRGGLAGVDEVVRSHGGAMRVSTDKVTGTSVEVYLPALNPGTTSDTTPCGVIPGDQGDSDVFER
ncbi:MAG: PAS domain S-box protein [Nitrospiraceae bacterium]